jgi:hypothetical protein
MVQRVSASGFPEIDCTPRAKRGFYFLNVTFLKVTVLKYSHLICVLICVLILLYMCAHALCSSELCLTEPHLHLHPHCLTCIFALYCPLFFRASALSHRPPCLSLPQRVPRGLRSAAASSRPHLYLRPHCLSALPLPLPLSPPLLLRCAACAPQLHQATPTASPLCLCLCL